MNFLKSFANKAIISTIVPTCNFRTITKTGYKPIYGEACIKLLKDFRRP